jgi:F0F1-type ATP synthase epsilon subunit
VVGNFLKRFGVGIGAVLLGGVVQYLGAFQDPASLGEFGVFAGLAAAIAALAAGALAVLKAKLEEKIANQ